MKWTGGFQIGDWRRIAFGIGVGLVVMLAVTGGFAWMMSAQVLGREHEGLASAGTLIISAFLGALCSGRGEGQIVRSAAVGAGMILVMLLLNLLLFDGSLSGVIPSAVVTIGASAAAGLIGGVPGNRRSGKYRYSKYRNR